MPTPIRIFNLKGNMGHSVNPSGSSGSYVELCRNQYIDISKQSARLSNILVVLVICIIAHKEDVLQKSQCLCFDRDNAIS